MGVPVPRPLETGSTDETNHSQHSRIAVARTDLCQDERFLSIPHGLHWHGSTTEYGVISPLQQRAQNGGLEMSLDGDGVEILK